MAAVDFGLVLTSTSPGNLDHPLSHGESEAKKTLSALNRIPRSPRTHQDDGLHAPSLPSTLLKPSQQPAY